MSSHLTPLEVCIRLIGDYELVSAASGMKPKASYAWRNASAWRDAGDMSPRANRAILTYSRQHGLGLTADHLIFGAPEAEIAAILAARDCEAA